MAKVKLNPALEAIHGHIGDFVFKRLQGSEFVGKMPDLLDENGLTVNRVRRIA